MKLLLFVLLLYIILSFVNAIIALYVIKPIEDRDTYIRNFYYKIKRIKPTIRDKRLYKLLCLLENRYSNYLNSLFVDKKMYYVSKALNNMFKKQIKNNDLATIDWERALSLDIGNYIIKHNEVFDKYKKSHA